VVSYNVIYDQNRSGTQKPVHLAQQLPNEVLKSLAVKGTVIDLIFKVTVDADYRKDTLSRRALTSLNRPTRNSPLRPPPSTILRLL
jgi:hypothetical protein